MLPFRNRKNPEHCSGFRFGLSFGLRSYLRRISPTASASRSAKAAGFRVAGVYEATAEQDQPEIQRLCDYYIRSYEELVQSETF